MIILQLSISIIFTLFIAMAVRYGLNLLRKGTKTPQGLKVLADTLYIPSFWIILGYGLFALLQLLSAEHQLEISSDFLGRAQNLFIILALTWIAFLWKREMQKLLIKKAKHGDEFKLDETGIEAIGKIIGAFIFLISTILVLDNLQVDVTALLAIGSVGAATIGFAGKDVFANFFGGIMIHINRSFALGEWIRSPNKNFEGIVEHIGWYITKIRTFDRRPTYIPNALFIDAIIENPSRMYNRRIKTTIGLRYQDMEKVRPITEEIREMLNLHPAVDQEQRILCHFTNYNDYSLDIELSCFTKATSIAVWKDEQEDILFKIDEIIRKHGAEMAFPTQTLEIQKGE